MFGFILWFTLILSGWLYVVGVLYDLDRALALEISSVHGVYLEAIPFLGSWLLLPVLVCMAVYYLVRWDWKKLILVILSFFVLLIGHTTYIFGSGFPV